MPGSQEPLQPLMLASLVQVFETAPVAIYEIDANGVVLRWNPASEAVFGWTAAEVIGRRLPHIPTDRHAEMDAARARILSGEPVVAQRVALLRASGEPVELSISTAPVRDSSGAVASVMVIAGDVTEQARVVDGLAAVLDAAPLAMWELSAADGNVLRWNPAAAALFGVPAADAVGRVVAGTRLDAADFERVAAGEAFSGLPATR